MGISTAMNIRRPGDRNQNLRDYGVLLGFAFPDPVCTSFSGSF
jgi:hypothetical protein